MGVSIDKFNINNIEDLIRNDKISKNDKQRCLKCFAYVREIYELTWIEPFNGHNVIQLEKLAISIRILPTGIIKYCKSLGGTKCKRFYNDWDGVISLCFLLSQCRVNNISAYVPKSHLSQ